MKSRDIRQTFLEYFQQRGHSIASSSPLVPANDPTLLFTNAGMVQFKEIFLGITPFIAPNGETNTRATTAQRCVRAGGKHNDLENVGYTARHHTFFEMLGNFSFGDYFKREAIQYAWEFLTEVVKLPPEKLWITVFRDDDEAADIWLNEIKVDPKRFSRCGEKDNFWAMGDTGPCGPCSEIFYDHGPEIPGGPPGSPDEEADRYIEIWNLVFMQYDRSPAGELTPLPKPSVDTGMGLERLAAVLQGVHSNYEIDLFQALLKAASDATQSPFENNHSLQVIADHIRSCSFLIVDGVVPSNEGRGYVLRRIIRRAVRHGHQLGMQEPFFHKLVASLVTEMGDAYPELTKAQAIVEKILKQEEEQFARTLDQGLKLLTEAMTKAKGKILNGKTVFKLYDTYGFPADLTADIARENQLTIDSEGFEALMAKQRQQSQQASQFGAQAKENLSVEGETEFHGYTVLEKTAKVTQLWQQQDSVATLTAGQTGMIALDHSPFYAESGGQVGDRGIITNGDAEFKVEDTQKHGAVFLHLGTLQKGTLKQGDEVEAKVDAEHRHAVMLNHSATHILHAALRYELGEHVIQKGSLVAADRLRFDFTHYEALTPMQLDALEHLVNAKIRANLTVNTDIMTPDAAQKSGAMALFGEKYGAKVRVLSMGDFSKELCGGTHVQSTGQIGFLKIISETSTAAGVRRIEAITGSAAVKYTQQLAQQQLLLSQALKTKPENIPAKIAQLQDEQRQLTKHVEQLKLRLASGAGTDLAAQAKDINGIKVLALLIPDADPKTLRQTLDQLKDKLGTAAIVLATVSDSRVQLIAGVTKDSVKKLHAGELVNFVAAQVGGKGGGRADMAQAGGDDPAQLNQALDAVPEWVNKQLQKSA